MPLALHACCGPCSLEPLRLLREQGYSPTILWTNPNIQPVTEHELRLRTLLAWARDVAHVDVVIAGDDRDRWERMAAPHGFDRRARCRACYALRLDEACRVAVELGFKCVSTTLAVSPYQLFDDCGELRPSTGLSPSGRISAPSIPRQPKSRVSLGCTGRTTAGAVLAPPRLQLSDMKPVTSENAGKLPLAAANRLLAEGLSINIQSPWYVVISGEPRTSARSRLTRRNHGHVRRQGRYRHRRWQGDP